MAPIIDITGPVELAKSLGWFLTLGKTDTIGIKDQLSDLLLHTSGTLKSLGELAEAFFDIKKKDFSIDTFSKVYWHCTNNYTNSYAAQKARSHCTDIERDIERIKFKITKILRTKLGKWSDVDKAFSKVVDSDNDFLINFETDMKEVQSQLDKIISIVEENREEAWLLYNQLRDRLTDDISKLRDELLIMREAENHIRKFLT